MATPLGFKTFVTGDVLTAADTNGYLMQGIWTFANAAARDAAVTSPQQGNSCYLKDTNTFQIYSGSAWVNKSGTSPLTTKGDLYTYSTTDARIGVGTDGQVLTAASGQTTGLQWVTPTSSPTSYGYTAGKNAIINGAFNIWQRGTSFTVSASTGAYTADRWFCNRDGSGATVTVSQQSFTPGTAPASGYESQYFLRFNQSVAGTGQTYGFVEQRIEDVRTFAGQTVTLSFWAKADSNRTLSGGFTQYFGSGGSASVTTTYTGLSVTTAWQRFTTTVSIPSVSGKTIGAGSFLEAYISTPINTISTIDIWGVQLESGSSVTTFQTATANLQSELLLAMRFYQKIIPNTNYGTFGYGTFGTSTTGSVNINYMTPMRTAPTASTSNANTFAVAFYPNLSVLTLAHTSTLGARFDFTLAAGSAALGYSAMLQSDNRTTSYIEFSSEL